MVRRERLISHVCSGLSGGLALFWLIGTIWAQVPGDLYLIGTIFYFALIALSFELFVTGKSIVVASWWPFLPVALRLAVEQRYRFRLMGIVSLGGAIGFVIVMTILQRQRRRAAQPGVEPDGPSARGLTP